MSIYFYDYEPIYHFTHIGYIELLNLTTNLTNLTTSLTYLDFCLSSSRASNSLSFFQLLTVILVNPLCIQSEPSIPGHSIWNAFSKSIKPSSHRSIFLVLTWYFSYNWKTMKLHICALQCKIVFIVLWDQDPHSAMRLWLGRLWLGRVFREFSEIGSWRLPVVNSVYSKNNFNTVNQCYKYLKFKNVST